jgi:hypothetical protein
MHQCRHLISEHDVVHSIHGRWACSDAKVIKIICFVSFYEMLNC